MRPKPDFLTPWAAAAFQDASVAQAYRCRPVYPAAVFDILADLIVDQPRHVLDVGAGTGLLARHLVERVDRVDAVDMSQEMIDQGKMLPGGKHPHLNWICGRVEDAPLHPPYALVMAGDSLHWMDWEVVMPRFVQLLTPNGLLAIMGADQLPTPWDGELWPIRARYSVMPKWQPFDQVKEVLERGLFQKIGMQRTEPVPFVQTIADYVESFHGRAGFSRERMGADAAAAFDAAVRDVVSRFCQGTVELQVVTEVVWGRPLDPAK